MAALLAVLAAGRRAARVPPTHALADAAVEPRLLGPGRVIGGLIALAGAAPLFAVSVTTGSPDTAAATSEMTALFLVAAVGFLGPLVARFAAAILGPPLARLSRVGGFLASANLRTATRRFSSASTPLDADGRHELHAAVQRDHDRPRRHPGARRRAWRASSRSRAPAGCRPRRWTTCAPRPACARRSPDADDARPEPRRLRRRRPRRDPQRRAGRRLRRGRDRRVARRPARRHDRARAPARRRRARQGRRPRRRSGSATGPARTRRSSRSTRARSRSATPCSPPSSRPATGRPSCSGRSSSRPATRPPSRGACARWPPATRAAGGRPRVAGHRERRRPRGQPLARPAVRGDHLRLHVDRRGQHAHDDRAAARPRARAAAARRRDPPPGALDGALGGRADRHDRARASAWRSPPRRCCRSATR